MRMMDHSIWKGYSTMTKTRRIEKDIIIDEFTFGFLYLSNFYRSSISYKGVIYPTAEHLYQALKTTEKSMRKKISTLKTPGMAKRMGRTITLRYHWEEIKIGVMRKVIRLKFDQNLELQQFLLATEDRLLVEGNWWHDNFWGDCICSKCKHMEGQNHLGKLLMKRRTKYAD